MKLIRKMFIKDYKNVTDLKVRQNHIILACVIGLFFNIILFTIKILIGILSMSISIISDAINNLSDFSSCLVTLFSSIMSKRPPDNDHPYGHERIEYISSLIISLLIIVASVIFLSESIKTVISGKEMIVSSLVLIILGISISLKIILGLIYLSLSKTINSVTLKAQAFDSFTDVISTSVILVGSLVLFFTKTLPFSISGVLGIIVSVIILFQGFKLIKESLKYLIGTKLDKDILKKIKDKILAHDDILGIHDVRTHMYGPSTCFMSIHVEVSTDNSLLAVHDLVDSIEREIKKEFNIEITIHVDPIDTKSEYTNDLKQYLDNTLLNIDKRLKFHDFRVIKLKDITNVLFDIIKPDKFKMKDEEVLTIIKKEFSKKGNFKFIVDFDCDYYE